VNVRAVDNPALVALHDVEKPLAVDWEPVDLATLAIEVRSPDYTPTTPTILRVDGEVNGLFYPGLLNQLFGEPGSAKSWIALCAALEIIRTGLRVLWIDYEDRPIGMVERLVALGADDDEIALLDYRAPSSGILRGVEWLERQNPRAVYGLIVIDSTGEAMAAGGVKLNDGEVATWFQRVKRLMTDDAALLALDHVAKNPQSPELYPTESQRKLAAVSGASYRADIVTAFAKGRDGKIKLRVAKDRPGTRPRGVIAAMIDLKSGPDGMLTVTIGRSDGALAHDAGGRWAPTALMEKVSRWLEMHPGSTLTDIKREVHGKNEYKATAVGELVYADWCRVEFGARNAQRYTMNRPYRENDSGGDGDAMPTETLSLGLDDF